MSKDKDYIRLIHDRRWLRLRRQRLTLHPVCEMCEKEGRVTAAVEVHHIVPVETGLTFHQKWNRDAGCKHRFPSGRELECLFFQTRTELDHRSQRH